ncbi:hypothetical protein WMF26_00475 [Sorangium sp. So ce185]|uniref:hypothetical protein n=1 Tax=Sorangium sp. So ce185 TaxID=3133287 RepID=UPI003F5DFCA8
MLDRWRQFRTNAGKWGVVRTVVALALALTGAAILTAYAQSYWPTVPGVALGFLIPYLARDALVEHAQKVRQFQSYSMIGVGLIAAVGRDVFKEVGPIGLAVALAFAAAQVGTYFWLLSDPRISIVRS